MANKFVSHFVIKIGGQVVSEEFMDDLDEVVVDQSLFMPSMFTIRLHDDDLTWVDSSLLDIGQEVQIDAETEAEPQPIKGQLIKGEITALEPDFSSAGYRTMTVRGYDKSHRLHRGKKTRTFLQKKDSDLARQLAQEAGLSVSVDPTPVTYEWLLQCNQTNMEFLRERAERIGYQVYVSEGTLYFKKGDASLSGTPPELVYLENLTSFQPCWTASGQADQMLVHGWDPKGKKAITSQKTPNSGLNQGGMSQTGGAKANSAFSSAQEIVVDRPVFTVDEASALADGLSNDISRSYVQAEGISDGDPRIKAGGKVKIKGVGQRFSGDYRVTLALHVRTPEGYETRFSISGRHPNTLSHLLASTNGHDSDMGLMNGVVTAMVTNLADPDDLGRVKVKFPWLPKANGAEIESHWIRIAAPMAGAQRGFMYLPEINDEVLVAFEHGDVHRPYIVGVLWSSTDKPPAKNSEATAQGKVNQRVLKTRAGHTIILDDKQGEEQISVTSKSCHTVILDDKSGSEKITIKDKTGKNEMVIDSTKNSMTINCQGDFSVTAKGKITLKSTQDMTLEATANAKVKGMQLALEGTSKGELKAAMISVNGSGQTEVKSAGILQIQGSLVKIN